MKQTIKGHIYWQQDHAAEPRFTFYEHDMRGWEDRYTRGRVWVKEANIEVEIPDNFDPRPGMIAALQAEEKQLRAEFAAKVAEINTRISKLQALTNEVEA